MVSQYNKAIGTYQSQSVLTAGKGQLITMAFDGLRKFIKLGIAAINDHNVALAHDHLMRAQAIVTELRGSLDHEKGGEIAANLEKLYDYMYRLLVKANMSKDAQPLEEALTVLQPIRDGWAEAVKLAEKP